MSYKIYSYWLAAGSSGISAEAEKTAVSQQERKQGTLLN
jgi:hypothetical protein